MNSVNTGLAGHDIQDDSAQCRFRPGQFKVLSQARPRDRSLISNRGSRRKRSPAPTCIPNRRAPASMFRSCAKMTIVKARDYGKGLPGRPPSDIGIPRRLRHSPRRHARASQPPHPESKTFPPSTQLHVLVQSRAFIFTAKTLAQTDRAGYRLCGQQHYFSDGGPHERERTQGTLYRRASRHLQR
jgi:hypothetical protein